MASLTLAQRQSLIDAVTRWVHETIADERNQVDFELATGVASDFSEDLMQPKLARNGTATLTIRINGGAQHTRRL